MAALAAVMLDDPNFPHGTPSGHAMGCKSARSCPELLSCKEANVAARHDYKVARMFKDGATPAQVAAYLSDGIEPVLTPAPESAPTPTTQDAKEHTVPTNDTHKPKPAPRPKAPKPAPPVGSPAAIRAWARAEGFEVGIRGPIQPIVVQKYNEAHGLTPTPDAPADEASAQPTPTSAVEPAPTADGAAEPEIARGGIVTTFAAPESDEPERFVPLTSNPRWVDWSEVVDIARRSDMLDETRERIGEPVDDDTASRQGAADTATHPAWRDILDENHRPVDDDIAFRQATADAATRPEWADVAAAAEIAAATRRAEQAEQIATRALAAVDLVLQKWEDAAARAQAAELDAARAKSLTAIVEEYLHRANKTVTALDAELAHARRPLIRFGGTR